MILKVKGEQVVQQDRALQKQSLLSPRLRQGSSPSSTNTYIQLGVDGDFSLDPFWQYKSILAWDQHFEVLKISLHSQTLADLWIFCKAVGQREEGDVLDAVTSCQISMKSKTYLNGGRAHGKVVGVEEEKEAVSKHLPDLLWI